MIDSLFTALGLDESNRPKTQQPAVPPAGETSSLVPGSLPSSSEADTNSHGGPQLKIITHIARPAEIACATPQIPPLSLRSLDSVEKLGSLPPTPLTLEIMKQYDRKPTFVLHIPTEAPPTPVAPIVAPRREALTPSTAGPEPSSPSLFDLAAICDAKRRLPSSGRVKSQAPFVKKTCGFCSEAITVKDTTLKCRKCKHCIHCLKDLKTGGGRHRLCPMCDCRCYDQRNGREACQQCRPTRCATSAVGVKRDTHGFVFDARSVVGCATVDLGPMMALPVFSVPGMQITSHNSPPNLNKRAKLEQGVVKLEQGVVEFVAPEPPSFNPIPGGSS